MSEPGYGEDTDSWADYSSEFMFPGDGPDCTCSHETVDHGYAGCDVDECLCEARWNHT